MISIEPIQLLGIAFVLVFFGVSETLRWYLIGRPLEVQLESRYDEALAEADRLGVPDDDPARELIGKARARPRRHGLWTGAYELSGWMELHRAEEMFTSRMEHEEVRARLAQEQGLLPSLPPAVAAAWTPVLERNLDQGKDGPKVTLEQARADLAAVLNVRHQSGDDRFKVYVDLNRRALLLGATGVLLVGGLMILFDEAVPVLLGGALGGFLSRLRRIFTATDTPSDYGASWVPLLLAPLVGALTGWAGIALFMLAKALGVMSLSISLDDTLSTPVVALALLFGFAERLFEGFSSSLADRAGSIKSG